MADCHDGMFVLAETRNSVLCIACGVSCSVSTRNRYAADVCKVSWREAFRVPPDLWHGMHYDDTNGMSRCHLPSKLTILQRGPGQMQTDTPVLSSMTKECLGEFGHLGQFTMKIFVREVELWYRQASRGIRFSRALRSVELMLALGWEATGIKSPMAPVT